MRTIFDFKDTCSGSIFVLGNGPSLDEIEDFSKLPYPTFGVNRSWRKTRSKWHYISAPDCYFKELAQVRWNTEHIFTPGRIENCYSKIKKHIIKDGQISRALSKGLTLDNLFNFIIAPFDVTSETRCPYVCPKDSEFPFVDFSTAGIMAMEIAKYMGFDTLYLLGFDGGHVGHFKTGEKDHGPTGVNHDACYHGKMELRYRRDNVKVYNCSMESRIATWPKKLIGEVINGKVNMGII